MKTPKAQYSVALSKDTGCIVMVKSHAGRVSVIGSLDKTQSDDFARSVLNWLPDGPAPQEIDTARAVKRALYQH